MGTPSGIGYIAVIAMLVPSMILVIAGIILHRKGKRGTAIGLWIAGAVLSYPTMMAILLAILQQF